MDRDKDVNGDIYYQLVRGNGDLFRVGRKSGRITLRKTLGSGGRDDYTLTVAAYDGGSPPYSSEIQVHVKVVDMTIPAFAEQSYRATVPENWETFAPILQATAVSPTESGEGIGSSRLFYTIESGNEDEIFTLDYSAGVLSVAQPLDYEEKQHHQLTLRATDSQSAGYTEAIIFLTVEDVNDCAPQFLNQSYEVAVSEALPHGAVLLQVEARDLDSGRNNEIEYRLLADASAVTTSAGSPVSDIFSIDPTTGAIQLRRSLDFERQQSHTLTVRATDRGTPPLSTDTRVIIRVLDSNDNAPEFEEAEYTIWLSDQARRGQYVGKVRAVDPDASDSGRLTYSIIGGNQHQIFSMDESNGIITLVNLHTFDQAASYLLNVSVSDGVYATSTKVRINLRSANRHSPEFARPVFEMKLKENSPEGSRIGQVIATDKDRDLLRYILLSHELGQLFRLDPYTGELWSEESLDRELRDTYEIPVMVTDQAGRSGFTTIKLSITDENDNAPMFSMSEYKVNIPANLTAGSPVIRLTALDRDAGRNAVLSYSIYETQSSGVDDTFSVDVATGQITLKRSALDLENSVYQFFVRAQDSGKSALHSDVPVEIYVMSPLDEAPRFNEHDVTYFVEEGSPVGLTVAELSAVSAPDSQVHYRIASAEYAGPDAPFQIDVDSGRLMVAKLLDREERSFHRLAILAETDSSPTLNVYTELVVQVLDENDHSPEFALPAYEVAVSEAVAAHTPVLQVLATDKDYANNGEVTYSFSEESRGSLAHLFSIDPHNGWITTQGLLDYETKPAYSLTVLATDNGKERRSTSTVVRIVLVDANDNPPVFSQRLYTAAVNEGALPGTIIFQLQTTDADTAMESHVEFAITTGDPLGQFQIKQNGEVYVARSLDREARAQYRMEVSATDGVFVSMCRVTIEILDDNDSPPVCSRYSYRHEVVESITPGTTLITVTATDADEGHNARQIFSISGGETADLFSVDRDTGLLSTALPLDREKQDRHHIRVLVQDADRLDWSCESRVEIVITDANDNNPEWDEATFEAALAEDAAIGTIVTKVHATDRDLRENRRVSYSLLDSAEGQFEVDSKRGLVSLARALDREERDSYNLTVRAMDAGRPRGTALTNLLVRVLGKLTKYRYGSYPVDEMFFFTVL